MRDANDAKHRGVAKAANAQLSPIGDAVRAAGAIVLAVPFGAMADTLGAAGDLNGHIVLDATNPLRMGASGLELVLGLDRSGGEQVAALAKGASVFKTLNQVGYEVMADTTGYAAPPVMFVAGDDAARKPDVLKLVSDLGFRAVDAGGLAVARLLEPFALLWIHMALNRKAGRDNAFAYLSRARS